jgi:hypothetical protein
MVLMVDKDVILFNKLGNCTIDKGLQLWPIDKCMIDTLEALEEDPVEYLID